MARPKATEASAVLVRWLDWLKDEVRASRSTREGYGRDLRRFLAFIAKAGMTDPGHVDTAMLSAFLAEQIAEGRAASSIARMLATLRNFFGWAERQGLFSNAAIAQLRLPEVPTSPKPAATEMAFGEGEMELVAFLSEDPWIAKRDLALFLLMGEVGLKLGEALALDRPAIPTRTRPILTVPPFAGKPERLVPVTPDMVDVIADYLSLCPFDIPEDGPLFVGLRGRRLNPGVIQRQMRRLRIHLGLPSSATPKMLRKQLALRLRAEGAGTREVQQRLGYAHTSSTLRAAPANYRGGGKGRG